MRRTARLTLAGLVTGMLLLTACGNGRSTSVKDTTVVTEAETTIPAPETTTADTATPETVASSTSAPASTTAATTAGGGGGTVSVTIDPALEKAIFDVDALLGSNDSDLDQAAKDAANGG